MDQHALNKIKERVQKESEKMGMESSHNRSVTGSRMLKRE